VKIVYIFDTAYRKLPLMKPHPPVGSPPRRSMSFRRPGHVMRSMSLRAFPGSQSPTKPRLTRPRLADMVSMDGDGEDGKDGKEKDKDGEKWATPAMDAALSVGPEQPHPSPRDVFRSQKNLFSRRDPRRQKTQQDLARVKERIEARKKAFQGDVLEGKRSDAPGTLHRPQSTLGGAVLSSASAGVTARKEDLEE
jgi:hypothetical protein